MIKDLKFLIRDRMRFLMVELMLFFRKESYGDLTPEKSTL